MTALAVDQPSAFVEDVKFVGTTAFSVAGGALGGYYFSKLLLPSINPMAGAVYIGTSSLIQACANAIFEKLFNRSQNGAVSGAIWVASFLTGTVAAFGAVSLTRFAIDPKSTLILTAAVVASTALSYFIIYAALAVAAIAYLAYKKFAE